MIFLMRTTKLLPIKARSAGFTLIETAIIMAVLGTVLGVVWVAASQVLKAKNITTATQEINAITQNIRAAYAEQPGIADTGSNALTQALDQLKAFPLDMRQNAAIPAGIIFNPWYPAVTSGVGSVILDADNCAGTADTSGVVQPCFGVTFLDVPRDACIQMVGQSMQLGAGLQQVNINTSTAGSLGGTPGFPVSPSTARSLCNNLGTAHGNDILWIYQLKAGGQ